MRRVAQVDRQRVRFLRQHQRIGRQRHAELADRGLQLEPAGDVLVGVERRGGDLAGDASTIRSKLTVAESPGAMVSICRGRIADERRAADVARVQVRG